MLGGQKLLYVTFIMLCKFSIDVPNSFSMLLMWQRRGLSNFFHIILNIRCSKQLQHVAMQLQRCFGCLLALDNVQKQLSHVVKRLLRHQFQHVILILRCSKEYLTCCLHRCFMQLFSLYGLKDVPNIFMQLLRCFKQLLALYVDAKVLLQHVCNSVLLGFLPILLSARAKIARTSYTVSISSLFKSLALSMSNSHSDICFSKHH